ncbi:hypothetical protein [Nocardia sp. CY41]|uniref:hypothetical protein n=1 Tax=Nocardia sp. CY41 TaxID=2608686 RepID=UPI001357B728|nr:hypothetical protein [Nocardia sp. CY41]
MPELAQHLTLDLAKKKLYIDGIDFPWYISGDGLTINNLPPSVYMPSVTLTFYPRDVKMDWANKKLWVDGQEFPWLISEEGPIVENIDTPDALPSVTLTFFVRNVEVIPKNNPEQAIEHAA